MPRTNQPVRSKVRDPSPTHTWYWREELEDVFLFDTWEGDGWKRQFVLMCMLSLFSRVWLFVTPWTIAYQAPLSVGFSRQEYWSGLPCPPPGDLPNPGIEPTAFMSPSLVGGFFTASTTWEALKAIPKLLLVVGRGETNFIGENVCLSQLWLL